MDYGSKAALLAVADHNYTSKIVWAYIVLKGGEVDMC